MSYVQDLPTKSEIYNYKSQKNDDVIVMNIHNVQKERNDSSITDANQTEANLKLGENYNNNNNNNINIDYNPPNKNDNIIFYDNTRENQYQYPFSENRGANQVGNMYLYQNNNNFAKSYNSYKIQDFPRKEIETNMLKFNEQNKEQLPKENINLPPKTNLIEPKKKNIWSCTNICICIFLTIIFPFLGIIFCIILNNKKNKSKGKIRQFK